MAEYLDACRLRAQGWSITAIAGHLGRDRKTVRSYLAGERVPGVRASTEDAFLVFLPYCRRRLEDDPHLQASVLFDEVVELGYGGGYSTFTRALRRHRVRPSCGLCHLGPPPGPTGPRGRAVEEIRFRWIPLGRSRSAPPGGDHVHLLTGTLAGSSDAGRWRGVLVDTADFPHVVEGVDEVLRRLGGTAPRWCFDRATPLRCPATGRLTPAMARVGRYYGAEVELDRARCADEDAEVAALRRWWSDAAHGAGEAEAQVLVDRLALRSDRRATTADRVPAGRAPTERAPVERVPAPRTVLGGPGSLCELPGSPYPVRLRVRRVVGPAGLVPFRGNFYSVPPDLAGVVVEVSRRLDETHLSIGTTAGAVIACHELAPRGAGLTVAGGLEIVGLGGSTRHRPVEVRPCPSAGIRRPLSAEATAEAERLRGLNRVPRPAPAARG
ncbi:Mu transposase domain-containing protein [Kitasatospora terrestris]